MTATGTANQQFYDALWSAAELVLPERFNTWPLLTALARDARARLEIGPGLHPRLPIAGTWFVDVSRPALQQIGARGGHTAISDITALPFPSGTFDLICAFDIIEHAEDDHRVFSELRRVAAPNAAVVFSVPLHAARWSGFDALVGHVRRYDPGDLLAALDEHRFAVEQSAPFGMEPRNRWLMDFAIWGLTRRRIQAMRWYNRFILPLGLFLQPHLAWTPGLMDIAAVHEIVLFCRADPTRPA
jgi:SAM-dependent methyltransferase